MQSNKVVFSANHNGGVVSTDKYPTHEDRGVIPTTNVGDIRIISTKNDIPTKKMKSECT